MKIVYIMGAGTSKEAGAPLLKEFFSAAENLLNSNKIDSKAKEKFNHVLEFRRKYLPNSNIEQLFSYLELRLVVGSEGSIEDVRNDLIYLIGKVLNVVLKNSDIRIHKNFMFYCGTENSTVISLNYDILCDNNYSTYNPLSDTVIFGLDTEKIRDINYGCNYTKFEGNLDNLKEVLPSERQKLLKLHGSLNWLYCKKHGLYSTLDGKVHHLLYEYESKFKCPRCKENLEPLIIPPSLTKLVFIENNSPLKSIWSEAFNELSKAEKVVIIGYSFPETDIHFKLFLEGAFRENVEKRKMPIDVTVVTRRKYGSDKIIFEDTYKNIFKSLNDTVRISFVYLNFSEYKK